MRPRIKRIHGVNVIAAVLMLITFFLVIGFAIGAISTMNLNLSGRSVKLVKADMIAEAVVTQFIKHVEDKARELMAGRLDNLNLPSLELETYYNGTTSIFESVPPYIGEECSADVHFVSLGSGDTFYSTDNSNSATPLEGARGVVPPFTIDLIITVHIGGFVKHYQVWIIRKWNYAIYTDRCPIMLLSTFDIGPPLVNHIPTEVRGDIFSRYNPPDDTTQPELKSIDFLLAKKNKMDVIMVKNRFPADPLAYYPAAVTMGGEILRREVRIISPGVTQTVDVSLGTCRGSSAQGKIEFPYTKPTVSPCYDRYVYPGNTMREQSKFGCTDVMSPFDVLEPVNDQDISGIHEINQSEYPGVVEEIYGIRTGDLRGVYDKSSEPLEFSYDPAVGPDPSDVAEKEALYSAYMLRDEEYNKEAEPLFFIKKTLDIGPAEAATSLEWGDSSKYVLRDGAGQYRPLVDSAMKYVIEFTGSSEIITDPDTGAVTVKDIYNLNNIEEVYNIEPGDNDFRIDNSMVIAREDIDLVNTDIYGENSLLQVYNPYHQWKGAIKMFSGNISAGENAPMVIYCNDFFCSSEGVFNGIIMARNSMKVAGTKLPSSYLLEVRGGVVVGGLDPDRPDYSYFDSAGIVTCGFRIIHDPRYTIYLNRCGHFRVLSWRDIE